MICVDTTFLIDLWREGGHEESPAGEFLARHAGEDFVVPAHAAGEFLEGGAAISTERLAESLHFLRLFRIGTVGLETALRYAKIVSELREAADLHGHSKADLWIAAWALEHEALLVTRNDKHFQGLSGLSLLAY